MLVIILMFTPSAGAQNSLAPLEPAEGVLWGAWPARQATEVNALPAVANFEGVTSSTLDFVVTYRPPHQPDLDVIRANHWLNEGKIPVITWRVGPDDVSDLGDRNIAQEVLAGQFDDQIRLRAAEARQIDGPWFSRMFHEMDGSTGELYGLTPATFNLYWRHVRTIFEEEGVTNAVWLWTTANFNEGDGDWYPGDDVVDWIGLDQFLFKGDAGADRCTNPGVEFETLDEKIGEDFWAFSDAHPTKPVMVAEWGVGWSANDSLRQDFINSAAEVAARPRVKALAWFNSNKVGGCEWELTAGADPDPGILAYSALVNDPAYEADVASLIDDWPKPLGVEVMHTVSCLVGNGRINTNIVNPTEASATYRLEFEGLTARQSVVPPKGRWRMPVTGRPDGDYDVTVIRDGELLSTRTLTVACDGDEPKIDLDEIRIINSCFNGDGYLMFQFVNPSPAKKSWVVEALPARNRSTTAEPWAQSVKVLSGRPDGEHVVRFRVGGTFVEEHTVLVDCDN